MNYQVGDHYKSKHYTEFEIIAIVPHYKNTLIITYNVKDKYNVHTLDNFEKYLIQGKYELVKGQVTMGVTL